MKRFEAEQHLWKFGGWGNWALGLRAWTALWIRFVSHCRKYYRGNGGWLFGDHQSQSELALSGLIDGQLVHAVVDLAFIDHHGCVGSSIIRPVHRQAKTRNYSWLRKGSGMPGNLLFIAAYSRQWIRCGKFVPLYISLIDGWWELRENKTK
ncbi:MAG: hypothetical protein R2864_05060 [Syntrophotaleaceae bacterium]